MTSNTQSSIVFLSDCTPVYSVLGSPGKITSINLSPSNKSIILTWSPPSNIDKIPLEYYNIRYGKTGSPGNMMNGLVSSSLPSIVVNNLENGVSYSFWISGVNLFGEGVLSDIYSSLAGTAPDAISMIRRSYHSTLSATGSQKIGIEFAPPLNYNGATPTTYIIKYSKVGDAAAPTSVITSVQPNELMADISGNSIKNTNGIIGNYVRREVSIPQLTIGTPVQYTFNVSSTNMFGTSPISANATFTVGLGSGGGGTNFTAPLLSLPNGDISGVIPGDSKVTFQWTQSSLATTGWKYRIQYSNIKDFWYSPNLLSTDPYSGRFPEYTVNFTANSDVNPRLYSFDISKNIVNGTRYYFRYCLVNPDGDSSQYTVSDSTNILKTSTIPGKLPRSPPIFNAAVSDRIVYLYFAWTSYPPSIELTGGYPILDYTIERYLLYRGIGGTIAKESLDMTYDGLIGPFYQDSVRRNGQEYSYRVYSRTELGLSDVFNKVIALPVRQSDVVRNVTSSVTNNQITLNWIPPSLIEPGMPIVKYYIEYRIYDIFSVPLIPPNNLTGSLTNNLIVGKNINDMNAILVDYTLWSKLTTTIISIYTPSTTLQYTVSNLVDGEAYVFRVAAVTQDSVRRNLVGLLYNIGNNSPYLLHPTIIGKVPPILSNISYMPGNTYINITWSSDNLFNSIGIINFIVEYRVYGSSDLITKVKYPYSNSILSYSTDSVLFSIYVTDLSNYVESRPNSDSHSYEITIYAENTVGFTNDSDKIALHNLPVIIRDPYENQIVTRFVRPGTSNIIIT